MKNRAKLTTLVFLTLPWAFITGCVVVPSQSYSRTNVGGDIVDGQMSNFYLSVGEYYRVPERDVIFIHERHIPDYDIPVVLFISQYAHIAPAAIIDLRLGGISWMDISLRFGLGPELFYFPVPNVYGSLYGNAYGHYQRRPRSEWHNIRLADADIMNLVNLRFVSERYRVPPEDVMRMRSGGKNFNTIYEEARRRPGNNDFRQQERGNAPAPVMRQERREQDIRQQERPIERESVIQQNRPVREAQQGQVVEHRQTRSENRDRTEQVNRPAQEPRRSEIRQQESRKIEEPPKQMPQESRTKTRQQEQRDTRDATDRQERKDRSPGSSGVTDGR